MKSRLFLTITLLVLSFLLISPALAAPKVILDGQQLTFDVPPVVDQGRVLVPMRAIFETLGASINWDPAAKTVSATKEQTTVKLTIGIRTAYKNGTPGTLDVPPKIVGGRTLVPLRFVSEALGSEVLWDGKTQTVTINSTSGVKVTVHIIDVGQGDAIYISLRDHNDILIDGGDNTQGSAVVSYLTNQGIDDIELLVATHPHADHIGGLDDVLAAFKVEAVVDNGMVVDTATYRDYRDAVKAEGCPYQKAVPGQSWVFGSYALKALGPVRDHGDANNNSVVCLLDCGEIEFLFTGDAEAEAEADLLGKAVAAEILKVGHHGSRTSTSQAFLAAVSPEVAVISVGAGNTYGHPAASTLQRLKDMGVGISRTDQNGTVIITTDGKTYHVIAKPPSMPPVINKSSPPDESVQPVEPASTGKYVGSAKSDKYHLPSCRYAEQIAPENRVWFSSEAEAQAAGYVACKVCGG
jgi:beta-lactamase superfamily II metal-dependent hydrolase